jgi:TonB family protein
MQFLLFYRNRKVEEPQFPGGKNALIEYLAANLQYPSEALANKFEGDVLVSFTVLETGEKIKFKVEESPHKSLSTEAIRLLYAMPNWEPAKVNGQPIAIRHAVSIPFKIEEMEPVHIVQLDSISNEKLVEKQPSFPGGANAMIKYLSKTLLYPADAAREDIQGVAMVSFVVTAKGEITNVQTVKQVYPSIDMEARRVIRSMPRWEPGSINGQPVNVKFTLPLRFTLHEVGSRPKPRF